MPDKIAVLLIEDNPLQADSTGEILKLSNPRVVVTWASTYSQGLELLCSGNFSICFLDHGLDEKNGLDLLTESRHRGCRTPVVMLTGNDDPELDEQALAGGAADYLEKTRINAQILSRVTRYALERHRVMEELRRTDRERELYFQAVAKAQQGMLLTDPQGIIISVNQALCAMYGYTPQEMLGRKPDLLNPGREEYAQQGIDAKDYDRMFRDLWESLLDPGRGQWAGQLINRTRDGRLLDIQLSTRALRHPDGELLGFFGMTIDVTARRAEEAAVRIECYRALTEMAEKRDCETGEHLRRISTYAGLLARQVGAPRRFVEDIEIFSPLHDIGKVGIPDAILLAPRRLTPEEFEEMKRHAELGYEILAGRPTLEMAADIAYGHHEKWDGTGYPLRLKGEATPLCARIMALADVYDALRSRRHYKPPWTHEAAMAEIVKGRGSHFDPQLTDAFLALAGRFAAIAEESPDE